MNETFMKEKPVFPLLLGMGMPMVLSMLVNSLYNIVDSYFVARISENAMEALSLVFPIQNFINAMAIGFGVGINALIATARGAGKENEARRAATQGVVLSVLHGIILAVICIVIMPGFLGMFTGDQEVIRYGVRYASVAFLFSPIIMAGLAFEKIFQAVGRMKVSMIALLGGCITNIILDPILIFGLAFFPKMGISGAAIATGVGQLISLVVYLAFYFRGPVPVKLEARYKIPGGNTMKKLYGIGIPAILNLALPSVMIFVLNGLLAQYSRSYVVILGIYYKLQTFLYFPASGIIQGMRPVIGYNFGAGERERVGNIYKITLAMAGVIMAAGTVLYDLQHADWCLYRQRGDHRSRRRGPPDHQRRIHRLNGLRNSVWCPGGNRHGCPVPCDLPAPLYRSHPSVRLYSLPSVRRRRGLERVLDHGVFGSSCG